jgi:hypothetical protein
LQPPEKERAAWQGSPISISKALIKPSDIATPSQESPEEIQTRRIARRFFLLPETAEMIARLHFGEARA